VQRPGVVNLLDFDLDALSAHCGRLGEKPFRAVQLFRWIHQRGVSDFSQMTDLARSLREQLPSLAHVGAPPVVSEQASDDGTTKWLFDVGGGNAVESVFIPEAERGTLCVSSQAGCAVGCRFCATGHQGFSRNLTTAEIVGQLWFAEHHLRARLGLAPGERGPKGNDTRVVDNVVMMGMGEPLQNYGALLPALRVMLHDHGYGLSRRRVTVSTSGVVPMIDRLRDDCPVALAVSLHAPDDALRDQLVPLNRKYPLRELLDACVRHGVRKVTYASTGGALYGEGRFLPATEDHPVNPESPYGVSKHTVEHYLYVWKVLHRLDYTVLRYPNVYGPRQNPHGEAGVNAIFIGLMLAGERPRIFGTGEQVRDYLYVGDVVAANLKALDHASGEVVNLGTGVGTSVLDIVREINATLGTSLAPIFEAERAGEIQRIYLDAGRARQVLLAPRALFTLRTNEISVDSHVHALPSLANEE